MRRVLSFLLAVALLLIGVPGVYAASPAPASPSPSSAFELGAATAVTLSSFDVMSTPKIGVDGSSTGGNYDTRYLKSGLAFLSNGYFVPADSVSVINSIFSSERKYFSLVENSSNSYFCVHYKIPDSYLKYKGKLNFSGGVTASDLLKSLVCSFDVSSFSVLESIVPSFSFSGQWFVSSSAAPSTSLKFLSSSSTDFSVDVDFSSLEYTGDLYLTYYSTVKFYKTVRSGISSQYRSNPNVGVIPAIPASPISGSFSFPDAASAQSNKYTLYDYSSIEWKSGSVPNTDVIFGPYSNYFDYPYQRSETINQFNGSCWWYGYGNGYPSSYSSYWCSGYVDMHGSSVVPYPDQTQSSLSLYEKFYLFYCIPITDFGIDFSHPFELKIDGILDFDSGIDIIAASIIRDSVNGSSDSTGGVSAGPFMGSNTTYSSDHLEINKIPFSDIELYLTDSLPYSSYQGYKLSGAGQSTFSIPGLVFTPRYFCIKVPNNKEIDLTEIKSYEDEDKRANPVAFPVATNSPFKGSIYYSSTSTLPPSVSDPDSIIGKLDSIIELLRNKLGCSCKDLLSNISIKLDEIKELIEKISGSLYDRELLENAENSELKPPSSAPGSIFGIFKLLSGFFGGDFQFSFDWFGWADGAKDFIVDGFGFPKT